MNAKTIEDAINMALDDLSLDEFPEVQVGDFVQVLKLIAEDDEGHIIKIADVGDIGVCYHKEEDGTPRFQFQRRGTEGMLDMDEFEKLTEATYKSLLLDRDRLLTQTQSAMAHLTASMKDFYAQAAEQNNKALAKRRN